MTLSPSSPHLSRSFVLLAPPASDTSCFLDVRVDRTLHADLLQEAQRTRGGVYVEQGSAQPSKLTDDGRHVQEADYRAWHLLTVNDNGGIGACVRYVLHDNSVTFQQLGISKSPLAHSENWGSKLRASVERELAAARSRNFAFAELGGWAVTRALRCTTEAVRMMLALYAISEWFGGALGVSTANRTSSSPILRKMGARLIEANGVQLPYYYDSEYRCELEVVSFDSSRVNPRFTDSLNDARTAMLATPVIAAVTPHRSVLLRPPPAVSERVSFAAVN